MHTSAAVSTTLVKSLPPALGLVFPGPTLLWVKQHAQLVWPPLCACYLLKKGKASGLWEEAAVSLCSSSMEILKGQSYR